MLSSLMRRGSFALLLLVSGVAACAPTEEEDVDSQEGAWVTRTCGVAPGDGQAAKDLNGRMQNRLAGYMNAERVACARVIVRTVLGRGLGERAAQIAIATAMVETNLENITVAVDYDSLGLFQQRPSTGWGKPYQLIDPVYATNAFLNAMLQIYGDSWRYRELGVVAQGVQRSAFPGRYQLEANDALIIVKTLGGGTTCPGGSGTVVGAIEKKYKELGGCNSFLGAPISDEGPTVSRGGRYSHFERGSIYWSPETGAHEVHGAIRKLWSTQFNWEAGPLGYPLTDEQTCPDKVGKFSVFEGGSIYYTPETGVHEVRGAIRDKYKELGWEAGALGYPISGEVTVPDGARSEFEHGSITWTRSTGKVVVEMKEEAKNDLAPGGGG